MIVRGACACRLRAGRREDRLGPPAGTRRDEHPPATGPRSLVAKFAVSPGVPDGAGMRRIVITGRAPGNEIEVTPAQLRAEILAIDRMFEKEGRAR